MPTRPTATNSTNSAAASAAGLVTPPRAPKPTPTVPPSINRDGVRVSRLVIPPPGRNLTGAFHNAK